MPRRSGRPRNPFRKRTSSSKATIAQKSKRQKQAEQVAQEAHWKEVFFENLEKRGVPLPVPEVLLVKGVKSRWDLAWDLTPIGLSIEVQGGLHLGSYGGHTSYEGRKRDMRKSNHGLFAGVLTLQYEPKEMLLASTADEVAALYRMLLVGYNNFPLRRFQPAKINSH